MCEALTDETIRTAVRVWCRGDRSQVKMRYGHISYWDVHRVTDMSSLFACCQTFNENIELWDVGNVKNMNSMFYNATSLNQPLNQWNVSNVGNMFDMFYVRSYSISH